MPLQRSKNSRAKERAVQIQREFFYDLIWLAFLTAVAIIFLPLASHASDMQLHVQKIGKLQAEMKKNNDELVKLAKDRSDSTNTADKEHLHKQIVAVHKQLQDLNDEYNEILTHIRFKHPEKDFEGKLEFHHAVNSVESIENDTTLDGKLDSFLNKFHAVYGQPQRAKNIGSAEPRKPASVIVQQKKEFDPDDVDRPIKLSK